MKEQKLVQMKNKIDALTNVIRQLLKDVQQVDTLARGTITAFQLHIGEERWDELVKEMKEVEKRQIKETQDKIKEEKKKFETPEAGE